MKLATIKKIVIILLMMTVFPSMVFADMGSKPSITITLENIFTTNYVIDLLVYDEDGDAYLSEMDCNDSGNPTYKQIETLYKINYDGWISESTRWGEYLLMSDILGNSEHEHYFGYFGTPTTYKIIIVYASGEIRISDTINRTDFTSYVTVDVNTMEVVQTASTFSLNTIIEVAMCLIVTVLVELIVAFIFKLLKELKWKNIIIVNTISQIFLQILLHIVSASYLINFLILEILVLPIEYLLYKKLGYNESRKKLIIYVIVANLITAILTFIVI